MRQLAESRQRLVDIHEVRAEGARQMHSAVARQVAEAIHDVEVRQQALMRRQDALLQLCRQLLSEPPPPGPGPGGCSSNVSAASASATTAAPAAAVGARHWHSSSSEPGATKQQHETGGQQQRQWHAQSRRTALADDRWPTGSLMGSLGRPAPSHHE